MGGTCVDASEDLNRDVMDNDRTTSRPVSGRGVWGCGGARWGRGFECGGVVLWGLG